MASPELASNQPASWLDIIDVETAACRLGLDPKEGRMLLEDHGLIRRVGGYEWVLWGAVYDFISGAGPGHEPERPAGQVSMQAPEVLRVREAVSLLRMRDRPARTWMREQGLIIDIAGQDRVLRSALLFALTPSPRVTRYTWGSGRGNEIHAEERPQRDGSVLWRVGHGFGCWTRDRMGMVHEPSPSSRTDEWLQNARWTREEAMVEGPKALAHLSRLACQDDDPKVESSNR